MTQENRVTHEATLKKQNEITNNSSEIETSDRLNSNKTCQDDNSNIGVTDFVFWDGNGKIIPHLLFEFFNRNGIGKYYTDESKIKNSQPVIVKIAGNVVAEVNDTFVMNTVKEYVHDCLDKNGKAPVLDSLIKNTTLFGDKTLKFLPTVKLEFISDTKESAYLFFQNGVVKVTADKISLHAYDEFDQYVWENSIADIEFHPIPETDLEAKSDFGQFLQDLSVVNDSTQSISRLKSLQSLVGYLLHRYKDGTTNKAIILMDVYVNGQPNGGSGKTLLIIAIGKVRNLSLIDGKKYDQKEWFGLSSVGVDCEVLLFDDVVQYFNFENIFPLLSTGLYKREKYKNHVFIPHEKAPKIAITTNYAINGDSSSHKRRRFEYEVSPTYSADFSPRDKFGRNFFDEWSIEDWNLFYNTMIGCLQVYLKDGLVKADPINLELTKLINATSEEFAEFAMRKVEPNTQINKKELYDKFLVEYPEYQYQLKQRIFTQWLRVWGDYRNFNKMEGHSGDVQYIIFSEKSNP